MKVACVGEAMIELSMSGTSTNLGVAGDTLNTAIYLKRAAPALNVDYVTALGSDSFSNRIRRFLAEKQIGAARIETVAEKIPGLYAIETDETGERSFSYWRSDAAARRMFQTPTGHDFSALAGVDVVHLSGISLAILPNATRHALCDYLNASDAKLSFDSNYRPALWEDKETAQTVMSAFWAIADFALPSIDDEMVLFDETADEVEKRFRDLGNMGALKRGPEGPLSLGQHVENLAFSPVSNVVDTTAAGDSFNGGYLGAILSGHTQSEALLNAHKYASHVIQHRGAIAPPMVD